MASISFQPLTHFCFTKPNEWHKWKQRFVWPPDHLTREMRARPVASLLFRSRCRRHFVNHKHHCKVSKEVPESSRKVWQIFYCKKKCNFWKDKIQQMHSATRWISGRLHYNLHQLADSCVYGNLKEEMIQDCLIISIRDESLSECLQLESDLTLEKAKKLANQTKRGNAAATKNTQR